MTYGDDPTTLVVVPLESAIRAARDLNEPGELNAEYARGQAELICDLYGLADKEAVIEEIAGPKGDRHRHDHRCDRAGDRRVRRSDHA